MHSLSAKEKKLFPIHDPLSYVGFELGDVEGTLQATRTMLLRSTEDFTTENEHVYVAILAMLERGIAQVNKAETMLEVARKIAERGGSVKEGSA